MKAEHKLSQRIALFVVPRLATMMVYLIGCTLRYEHLCESDVEPGVLGGQLDHEAGVYCFWHRALIAAGYYFRNLGITVLVSHSFDGELITRTSELWGFRVARGSSSRGGAEGLLAMETAYHEGRMAVFTTDGPRGPRYVAKPGVAVLAERTGSDVVTFYVLPERAWELRTWDRMLIPKPFSRVVITWAKPVPIKNVEEDLPQVQAALDRTVQMAEEHWASKSSKRVAG
jgi:lysophospholipid acyltransferase (LPLAT)-like uncharacterized protein